MKASAKLTICAPFSAAWAIYLQVFSTEAGRSSHSGSSWVTATRTVGEVGDEADGDMAAIRQIQFDHLKRLNNIRLCNVLGLYANMTAICSPALGI